MTAPVGHKHVSERDGEVPWNDCTWCAGVMFARQAISLDIPATTREAHALRADSGEPELGGSSTADLTRGLTKRYGVQPGRVIGNQNFPSIWSALAPGTVAAAQGLMGAFARGHRLRRWDRAFDGGHDVFIARIDTTDRVWWDDPLAPRTGYTGEWVSKEELRKYISNFSGGSTLVAPVFKESETVAAKEVTSTVPAIITIPQGSTLYAPDGKTVWVESLSKDYAGQVSPYAAGDLRAWYVTRNGTKQVGLSKPSQIDPVVDTTPFDDTDMDAAGAIGHDAGVKAEQDRIRALLGL